MTLQQSVQTNKASKLIEDLLDPVRQLEKRVSDLESSESIRYLKYAETNVSNPPTAAELTAAFGDPSVVGKGYVVVVNDNGAGANFYLVASDGASWWYISGTKAV